MFSLRSYLQSVFRRSSVYPRLASVSVPVCLCLALSSVDRSLISLVVVGKKRTWKMKKKKEEEEERERGQIDSKDSLLFFSLFFLSFLLARLAPHLSRGLLAVKEREKNPRRRKSLVLQDTKQNLHLERFMMSSRRRAKKQIKKRRRTHGVWGSLPSTSRFDCPPL